MQIDPVEAALAREADVPLPFPDPLDEGEMAIELDQTQALPVALSSQFETPPDLFNQLHSEFLFTIDAAASVDSALLPRFWTPADDGLVQDWDGERVWLNPPYGRGQIPLWLRKVRGEQERGVLSVVLLPALTDTRWFHDLCAPFAEVRFVRGRLSFRHQGQSLGTARFASLIAIYRPVPAPYRWTVR